MTIFFQKYFFLISFVFVLVLFGVFIDYSIINPFNYRWINFHDLVDQFIGWLSYKNSNFTFPISYYSTLLYPIGTNTVQTDGMPLFSFITKVITFLYKDPFQHYGIWILLCLYLNYIAGVKLVCFYTKNITFSMIAGVFFSFNYFVLSRFSHPTLMAHWIILFTLLLILKSLAEESSKKELILFCSLIFVSLGVHFYIFCMCFALMCSYVVIKKKFWYFTNFCFTIIASYFFFGYNRITSSAATGIEKYGVKLSSLFDQSIKDLYEYDYHNYVYKGQESLVYVGLIVMVFSLFLLVKSKQQISISSWKKYFCIIVAVGLMFMFSLGPIIFISNNANIDLTGVYNLLGDFPRSLRACGRFFWPGFYCVLLFLIVQFYSKFKKATFFLFLIAVIHIFDMFRFSMPSVYANNKNYMFDQKKIDFVSGKKIIHFFPPYVGAFEFIGPCHDLYINRIDYQEIALNIALINISSTSGYVGRASINQLDHCKKLLNDFKYASSLSKKSETLYFVFKNYVADFAQLNIKTNCVTMHKGLLCEIVDN